MNASDRIMRDRFTRKLAAASFLGRAPATILCFLHPFLQDSNHGAHRKTWKYHGVCVATKLCLDSQNLS